MPILDEAVPGADRLFRIMLEQQSNAITALDALTGTMIRDARKPVVWDAARLELKRVADLSPMMVWIAEPDVYCIYLNQKWYEFTGQAPGAGEGNGWVDALHKQDQSRAAEAFDQATMKGLSYHVEYRLCRHDTQYEWVVAVGHPYFTSNGCPGGYIGTDVSEEGLRRQRREKGKVLTPREREVVEWVAKGKTSVEISMILDIASRTVEQHVQSAMVKFGTINRVHMTVEAIRRGEIKI